MAGRAFFPIFPPGDAEKGGSPGFDLPLLYPGALDATTLELYKLLGAETINIIHEGKPYVTFASDASRAIDALDTLSPADRDKLTRRVPVSAVPVPRWQAAVSQVVAEFYTALGVRTTTLVDGGTQFTFLIEGDHILEAKKEFDRRPGAAGAPAAAPAGGAANPTMVSVKVKGVYLKRVHAAAYPPEARAVALLVRAKYAPMTGPGGVPHWVLCDKSFADTVAALAVCA